MNAVIAEAVPTVRIANILRKQHFHLVASTSIFCEGPGHQDGSRRIEDKVLGAKHPGNRFHHCFRPLRMLLGSDAVLYDRFEERMARRCTKGIVPNLPIHPILLAQEAVNAQVFEWEYATEFK